MLKVRASWIFKAALVLSAALGCVGGAVADTVVIPSNAGSPGDFYTSHSASGATVSVGTTGWTYANVRNDATIGINTTFARSGDGSVYLSTTGTGDKADIMYGTEGSGPALGLLSDFTSLSYDWYTQSSTVGGAAPSLRIYVGDGTHFGYLVWDPANNGSSLPTGAWQSGDAFTSGVGISGLYGTGNLPNGGGIVNSTPQSMVDWKALLTNYSVYGVNAGVGSGWNGNFVGAVDNIAFGFGANSTTYNFEAVPEPSSVALALIAGGAGLAEALRRRRGSR